MPSPAAYHNLTAAETLKHFNSSERGLGEREAAAVLKKYGPNVLPKEKKLSRFKIFLSQFRSPLIYILLGAATLSAAFGDAVDSVVVVAAVLINVVVGFIQEDKANRALAELKKIVKRTAVVFRGGKEYEIAAEYLVPGDIVVVSEGDIVPADGRILSAANLEVDESGLTGESLPISKIVAPLARGTVLAERRNMVYMGTAASGGRGIFVVTETGSKTRFGEIALLLREVKEERTPLEARIEKFSYFLGAAIVFLVGGMFIFGVFAGRNILEMLLISAAMAVASIPEGLPAAVTIILAFGARALFKKKALLRRMVAAETLGSATVICTDKTGTLTLGEMRAEFFENFAGRRLRSKKDAAAADKNDLELAAKISVLCNNAALPDGTLGRGNLTERALLFFGRETGFKKEDLDREIPRLSEIPFSSEQKYMATLHRDGDGAVIFMKGAPEIVLAKCAEAERGGKTASMKSEAKKAIAKKIEEAASAGLRVLALAYKRGNAADSLQARDLHDMVYVGFIAFADPLRPHSAETIALARAAGVRTVMLTGDHRLTAASIGREIGLRTGQENILEGPELDAMPEAELSKAIWKVDIFARVSPRHKVRIAAAWAARGEVVAMTGDGVNDAPAVKEADIGIALGTGSDVTKQAADIVLLDNNFKTIVSAIERGRVIFENIRSVIVYLLSDSFVEIILIAGSLILGLPLPLSAAQILWINIFNDTFPGLSLAFDRGGHDVMKERPRRKTSPLLSKKMKAIIMVVSLVTALWLLGIYYFVLRRTDNLIYSRTIAFAGLAINSLFIAYSCRNLRKNIWNFAFWKNKVLNISILAGILSAVAVVYLPPLQTLFKVAALDFRAWPALISFGILNLVLIELVKWFFIRKTKFIENGI